MENTSKKIDVLICVADRDINYLLFYSITSCIQNFHPLGDIYIITNAIEKMKKMLIQWNLTNKKIYVFSDEDILEKKYLYLKGWYKQQLIKLHSDLFCKTKYICCLGADAIIMQHIEWVDLFDENAPYLFFNRYPYHCNHLEFERSRLEGISNILQVEPERSYLLGDFIMELMILDSRILKSLRIYLEKLYGEYPFCKVINNITDDIIEGNKFGEWSIYSMYILDVLHMEVSVINSRNEFVTQLHSQSDLALYNYHSKIIHFVNKSFSKEKITAILSKYFKINHVPKIKMGEYLYD